MKQPESVLVIMSFLLESLLWVVPEDNRGIMSFSCGERVNVLQLLLCGSREQWHLNVWCITAASGHSVAILLSSFVVGLFVLLCVHVCECGCFCGTYRPCIKDHITHNGICTIIALQGVLIIHSASSPSPPTACQGVYVRLGAMSPGCAFPPCI